MSKMTLSFEIVKNNDNTYLYNMYYPDLGLDDKIDLDNNMLKDFLTPLLNDLSMTFKNLYNIDILFDDIYLGGGVYKHNSETFKEVVFNGSFQLTFDDLEISNEANKCNLSDLLSTFLKRALNQEAIGMNYDDKENGLDTFFVKNQDVTLNGVTSLYTKIISSRLLANLDSFLSNIDYSNLSDKDIKIIDETLELIDTFDTISVENILDYLETFDKTFSRGVFENNGIKDCVENYMDNLLIVPSHNSTLMVTTFDDSLFNQIQKSLDILGFKYDIEKHGFQLVDEDKVKLPKELEILTHKYNLDSLMNKFNNMFNLTQFDELNNEINSKNIIEKDILR